MPPVLEFLLDFPTHLKAQFGCYRHIACIEEAMDVTTRQESIARFMLTALSVWTNMRHSTLNQHRQLLSGSFSQESSWRGKPKLWSANSTEIPPFAQHHLPPP